MKFVIAIPQFNDWEALNLLIEKINEDVAPQILEKLSLVIIDDCSTRDFEHLTKFKGQGIRIVRLYRNFGHQRAIALGLSYIAKEFPCDKVIVMDADGEDAPKDINALMEASEKQPDKIIFAQRTRRQEGFMFQLFYRIYKFVFKQLTGQVITFGNFCVIPQRRLQSLVRVSEIWNNFPGGIIKSRLPYESVPIERAKRLAGNSKMNFVSLVMHGLSAISVLIETTAVRILILSIMLVLVAFVSIFVLVVGWYFDAWKVMGWTSTLSSAFVIVMLQAFVISLFLVFMVLQYRTQQQFIPVVFYKEFVERVDEI